MKRMCMAMLGLCLVLSGGVHGAVTFDSPQSIYSSTGGGYGVAMAVKAGDVPCFAYSPQYAAWVYFTDNLGESRTNLAPALWTKFHVAIAIDPAGDAHVVWADGNGGWKIYYCGQSGGVWNSSAEIVTDACTARSSIDISADADGVHVIWSMPTVNNAFTYHHRSLAGVWSTPLYVNNGYQLCPQIVCGTNDRYVISQTLAAATYTLGVIAPYYAVQSESFATKYQIPSSWATTTGIGGEDCQDAKLEAEWRGSVLDVALIGSPNRDATSPTTGAVYLYLDALGESTVRVTVFDDHVGTDTASASWVDMAIDPEGNHYVFFAAKTDGSAHDRLYMQEVGPDGTLIGSRQTLTDDTADITWIDAEWGTDRIHVGYQSQADNNDFSYNYLTAEEVAAPTFSHIGKYISGPMAITITCSDSNATIYYSDTGNEPTTPYTGPVTVEDGTTLKAKAVADGYSPSSITSVTYEVPASYDRPETIPFGTASVDGDLSDWSGASWTPLDQAYNLTDSTLDALTQDVPEAYYAARWQAGKVYVAVKVRDMAHSFTDTYTDWDARDAVEIYLHTDNNDDPLYIDCKTAQQYVMGIKNSNHSQVWTAAGGNFTSYPLDGNDFFGTGLAMAGIDGEWLNYEIEMTPFTTLGIRETGDLSTSVITQLDAGEVIGLDVCVVGHNGNSYAGMKSENMKTDKCGNWEQFGLHKLVDRIPGDANEDGLVDVGDLGILAANYGTTTGAMWGEGDFTGDGAVDVGDLGVLAANYGTGTSGADWDADYAKVFGATVSESDDESGTLCSGLGLPLIAGLFLMGLMLVKLDE